MKKLIIIVFVCCSKIAVCQDSIIPVRTYTAYHFISQNNFNLFNNYLLDLKTGKSKQYREKFIFIADSIHFKLKQNMNSKQTDSEIKFIERIKNKLIKKRKIKEADKIKFMKMIFFILAIKNNEEPWMRSSGEIDRFLHTLKLLQKFVDSNHVISKFIADKRPIAPFAFSRTYPRVEIFYKSKENYHTKIKAKYVKEYLGESKEYVKEINKRLQVLIQFLNNNFVIIMVQTEYP